MEGSRALQVDDDGGDATDQHLITTTCNVRKREHSQSELPSDLLVEILIRQPLKSIFRFKCVSKHWQSLISRDVCRRSFRILYKYIFVTEFEEIIDRLRSVVYNSSNFSVLFLSTYEERQRLNPFKVLAVSNGLILCFNLRSLTYYVCDPVTWQFVTLPQDESHIGTNKSYIDEGLVSQVNEENVVTSYRVVRFGLLDVNSNTLELKTLSSETGEWTARTLSCPQPIRLRKRGGPIHFNGILHWFVHEHGMVAFDPYSDAESCRLIQFPDDRDFENEYDGLYRLCDERQGKLKYFRVAPESSEHFCFSMWVLEDYAKGKWVLEFRVARDDLWSNDANLSSCLLGATFIPLCFHPFDLDVVYMRCKNPSCIVSYDIRTNRLDVSCLPVGIGEDLSWRVVIPFVPPIWRRPTPLPIPRPEEGH